MTVRAWHRLPRADPFDVALAAALFLGCQAEVIAHLLNDSGHDHWPLAANFLVVAGLTVPLAWRRRAPLPSLVVVESSVFLLAAVALADVQNVNLPQLVLFIAPYSVAAYAARGRALLGLANTGALVIATNIVNPSGLSSWVFSIGASLAAWVTGRILRARRTLTAELRRSTDRLAAERGGKELLAVTEQRTRIARELQTLIAHSVSTMIVHAQTAQRLLDKDAFEADHAMETIETTGREALAEMRRILGVLRNPDEETDLTPQPGVGQIPALIERARNSGRQLALLVEGEAGPLPASVDLGVYRILEDTLQELADLTEPITVTLRFRDDDVELDVTFGAAARLHLPTMAMRERVALCQGTVDVDVLPGAGERLAIRMPRLFDGVLA